jgi:hypothetical protein
VRACVHARLTCPLLHMHNVNLTEPPRKYAYLSFANDKISEA